MDAGRDRAIRRYRRLLSLYPRRFRRRFGDDMVELFADAYPPSGAPRRQRLLFWMRIIADTARHALRERLGGRPQPRVSAASAIAACVEDVRGGVRSLRQQPGTTAAILITLTLAIGANSALFTIVNAVLLRPLPYAAPERVVMLFEVDPAGRDSGLSLTAFDDLQRALTSIAPLSLMGSQTVNLTGADEPERLRGGFVTARFFELLGVQPIVGRPFAEGEDQAGAERTAVLSYRVWQARFGADPSIVGRTLILNNEPHTVIGVTSPAFEFPLDDVDVWLPYSAYPIQDRARGARNAFVLGRLRDGVAVEAATAELRAIAADWSAAYPDTNRNWSMRFERFHEIVVRSVRRNLQLLLGAVGCILLIACANVANLLLARASARQREMAVRVALGASRARLVVQLLAESVSLALAGGALGLLGSAVLTDSILAMLPTLPRADRVAPDGWVVLFTAAISIATAFVFGLLPALRLSRPDLRSSLAECARTGDGRRSGRFRAALVVSELALSLMLLVAAGLFTRSLTRLANVDLGYDRENVLTLEYRLPRNKYRSADEQWAFHRRVVERVAAVPGVQYASVATAAPQSGNGSSVGLWRSEDPRPSRDAMPRAQFNAVSDDFFRAMGTPLIEGRSCGPQDAPGDTVSVIVNRLLAERLWPGASAIGKRLRVADAPAEAIVVGVAGNTRPRLPSQPVALQVYGCFRQVPGIFATVILRTSVPPLSIARSVQQAIWSIDPDQPVWKVRTAETMVAGSVQNDRFATLLMSLAAGLALVLAVVGTYSVLAQAVQRRSREMGVRLALGASGAAIIRLVLRQTAILTLCGLGLGTAGALALSRIVEGQLYEVSARDPLTLIGAALTLGASALAAAWLPTRSALAVDPMVTLRRER